MASSQQPQYPVQPQPTPIPDYDKHHPNTSQNAPAPPQYPQQQQTYQYPQQQYGNVPPPPPPGGTYIGTTLHTPQQGSWVSNGANVAGFVIAGRCLIGFVTSGIFLIITSLIMFVQANNIDSISRNNNFNQSFTNPLRIMAPIFLTLGIVFLIGGVLGIIFAVKAAKKQRAEAFTTTSTVIIPAPIVSGRQATPYGQQPPPQQPYYGSAYPQGTQSPAPNQAPSGYPQQGYAQGPVMSGETSQEAPPPYQQGPQGPNAPLEKY